MDQGRKAELVHQYPISDLRPDGDMLEKVDKQNKKKIEERVCGNIPLETIQLSDEDFKPVDEMRIVLLGMKGAGKSTVGNLLIGRKVFQEGLPSSPTSEHVEHGQSSVGSTMVRVIDTPCITDMENNKDILSMIQEWYREGIHIFLYVYNIGNPRLSQEQLKAFQIFEKLFGREVLNHCVLTFTHASSLGKMTRSQYMDDIQKTTKDGDLPSAILKSLGDRVVTVETVGVTLYEEDFQRQKLFEYLTRIIEKEKSDHGNQVYILSQEGLKKLRKKPSKGGMSIYENKLFRRRALAEDEVAGLIESKGDYIEGMTFKKMNKGIEMECPIELLQFKYNSLS